jgi:23S rRNA (guanosine2251-2'-O)-methyltransferase
MSEADEIIYGKNSILECLDSEISINKIWIGISNNPKLIEIEKLARAKKIPVIKSNHKELERISGTEDHRSVVASISPIKLYDENFLMDNKFQTIVIPANIEDPHNLGAIIRSSLAFGVDAIAISNRRSAVVNSTVIQASAGAALKLPIARIGNINNTIEKLKKVGFWVYGTSLHEDNCMYLKEIDFPSKLVLILGNEAKGVSANISKHCDANVFIPMNFESLNVSVAAGIILSRVYEQKWSSKTTTKYSA